MDIKVKARGRQLTLLSTFVGIAQPTKFLPPPPQAIKEGAHRQSARDSATQAIKFAILAFEYGLAVP